MAESCGHGDVPSGSCLAGDPSPESPPEQQVGVPDGRLGGEANAADMDAEEDALAVVACRTGAIADSVDDCTHGSSFLEEPATKLVASTVKDRAGRVRLARLACWNLATQHADRRSCFQLVDGTSTTAILCAVDGRQLAFHVAELDTPLGRVKNAIIRGSDLRAVRLSISLKEALALLAGGCPSLVDKQVFIGPPAGPPEGSRAVDSVATASQDSLEPTRAPSGTSGVFGSAQALLLSGMLDADVKLAEDGDRVDITLPVCD